MLQSGISINGEYTGDTPIGKLMHDFKCSKSSEMYYPDLAQRAHYIKDTERGRSDMCELMQESIREAERLNSCQIARDLIRMGIGTKEQIAKVTKLTLDEVTKLAKDVENETA